MAVVVGCGCPNTVYELSGPKSDAIKFRDLLIKEYGFLERDITFLVDRDDKIVTALQILEALAAMIKSASAENGDVLVFYFSGHGEITKQREKNYNHSSGRLHSIIASDEISISDVKLRHLSECVPPQCSFYIIGDCCRGGGMVEGVDEQIGSSCRKPVKNQRNVELPDKKFYKTLGLTKTFERPTVITITACQSNEFALESTLPKPYNHLYGGLFTHALITVVKEMKTKVSNKQLVELITNFLKNSRFEDSPISFPGLYCEQDHLDLLFLD